MTNQTETIIDDQHKEFRRQVQNFFDSLTRKAWIRADNYKGARLHNELEQLFFMGDAFCDGIAITGTAVQYKFSKYHLQLFNRLIDQIQK